MESRHSLANDLFWDYYEPLVTRLDEVVTTTGWPVLERLIDTHGPASPHDESLDAAIVGNAVGRFVIRTRTTDGVSAIPTDALTCLRELRGIEAGAEWEEAATYAWGIGHPDTPVTEHLQRVARNDAPWVSSALEHAFYVDQRAACECLAEIVTDDGVGDLPFVFDAVKKP